MYLASSARLHRAKGTEHWQGKLHAAAVTCARTSGGKTPRCPRSGCVGERSAGDPAGPPLAHLSITGTHFLRDLLIAPLWMVMGIQDYMHTDHLGLPCGMRSD